MMLRPVLLYTLFFITAFVVFLFLLFPQKQAAEYLSRSLSDPALNVHFSIDNVKPVFPAGLSFENTKILLDQDIQIMPGFFKVFFSPLSLFREETQIKFQSGFSKGSANGSLCVNSIDPFLFSQAILFISGVKIENFIYKTALADMVLGCELKGEYKQIEPKEDNDYGHGTIFIQNFSSKLKNSFFNTLNLPMIDFSSIELDFTQNPNTFTLIQCAARGSIINVNLNGTIEPVFPLQESRLNLTGKLLPDSPYLAKFANTAAIESTGKNISKDGIKFRINGTLKNPKIGI